MRACKETRKSSVLNVHHMKNFYITTAIDYANGAPHLGHAYEKVLTDVVARFRRLQGDTVHFLTGLDEHGQKVHKAATAAGVDPIAICDGFARDFQSLCQLLNISNDDYIRTTEARHKQVVTQLQQALFDKGDIYQGEYHGYYSVKEEQFLTEKEMVDGKWPAHYGEVNEIIEHNYFFKLSQYQDWLIEHIQSHENFIFPRFRAKQVLEFLKEPINDLCISRPQDRLPWGIPLPFDENYVTYVWFDALINYVTGAGYGTEDFAHNWPADYHVIGKDILVPAHAVYWPIMLKACGIALPKSLLVHGFWLNSGQKLSKSTGNVINPLDLIEQFSADSFRYFLIREMNVGQDSDFSYDQFLTRYTDDLGNDLGNLVSRLLNMGGRYADGAVPAATVEEEPETTLTTLWDNTSGQVLELFEEFQFHKGLDVTFAFIRGINRYAEVRAPWQLAKSDAPEDQAKLYTTLAVMAEGLRLAATLLTPVMPDISGKILTLLGESAVTQFADKLTWSTRLEGKTLGEKTILFPRPQQGA